MSHDLANIEHVKSATHSERQVSQDRKEVLHAEGIHRATRLVASSPVRPDASFQVQIMRDVAHWQQQRCKAAEKLECKSQLSPRSPVMR